MDKEIFTLISRDEDKVKLFTDLAAAHAEILCKGSADSLCHLRPRVFNPASMTLECQNISKIDLRDQEEFLGYFFLGGEKYYFQGRMNVQGSSYLVSLPKELYHLQRRQNYRVRIPDGYHAAYNIVSVNGSAVKIAGIVADMSAQGCRVLYRMDKPLMKMGDTVVGQLMIPKRDPIEVQGIVRHIKIDDGNKVLQTFGIEFTPLPAILENKLFAITMEIHKELFRRP